MRGREVERELEGEQTVHMYILLEHWERKRVEMENDNVDGIK